ncbi:MAG: O-antigen ligase family protein [Pseudomonadota bacterium]
MLSTLRALVPQSLARVLFDRIQWSSALLVACFVAVLWLPSQTRASYVTYLLLGLMLIYYRRWQDVIELNLMRWICVLLSWMCLTALWSAEVVPGEVVSTWVRGVLLLTFVAAAAECHLRGYFQRWLGLAMTVAGALTVLVAIANFWWTNPEDGRLNGLGQLDTHVVAALIFGVVALLVIHQAYERRLAVWVAVPVVIMIAVAILLSDSRNAWVSVGLGCATYLASRWLTDVRVFVLAGVAAGVVAAVMLLAVASSDVGGALLLPRGDSFRFAIWSEVLAAVRGGDVIWGMGINTVDDIYQGGIVFQHPHNMYLAVYFQAGLIGLGLWVVVIAKTLGLLLRNYSAADAKLALSILVVALLSYSLDGHELVDKVGETWFLFWLPVALALGLAWRVPRQRLD